MLYCATWSDEYCGLETFLTDERTVQIWRSSKTHSIYPNGIYAGERGPNSYGNNIYASICQEARPILTNPLPAINNIHNCNLTDVRNGVNGGIQTTR